MKKVIFLFLIMLIFNLSATDLNAQSKKAGTLYEFTCDPSLPTTKATNKAVAQWFVDNFDEFNIPLISYMKVFNQGGAIVDKKYPIWGLDSLYRRYPVEVKNRGLFWNTVFEQDTTYTRFISWPYFSEQPAAFVGNFPNLLASYKHTVDSLREEIGARVYVTTTSKIEDGYYVITATLTAHPNLTVQGGGDLPVLLNLVLAEAYHSYGTGSNKEEHFFTPRYFCTGANGNVLTLKLSLGQKSTVATYRVPLDKEWNPKYLYTVAWTSLNNVTFEDVTTDNVVNVKAALTATPLKLEVTPINNNKFQQIKAGDKALVSFTVTNPTSKTVEAIAYINKNLSNIPENYSVSLNKTQLTIPAGQTTTVTATVQTSNISDICGLDFCVLPINTAINFNPVISSAQAVVSDKDIKAIIFTDKNNFGEYDIYSYSKIYSAHDASIGILNPIFHTVVPTTSFEAFIYNKATFVKQGRVLNPFVSNSYWLNPGTYNMNFSKEVNGLMADYLTESELDFLLEALAANKHLALFFDKSHWYYNSKYASSSAANKFNTLCQNFGISVLSDSTYYLTDPNIERTYSASPFVIKCNLSDSLGIDKNNNGLIFNLNTYSFSEPNFSALYGNRFNIINSSKSTSIAYYDPSITSCAIVKTRNGNQKLLVGGFAIAGIKGTGTNEVPIYNFFGNLFTWWFGYKAKLEPKISLKDKYGNSVNTLNFGTVERPNSVTDTMYIQNIAEPDKGALKIYNCVFDFNEDEAFEVLSFPKNEIAPGEQAKLIIKFTPKYVGDHNITLSINCNDPINSPFSLYISGVGKNPAAGLEPKMVITPNKNYYNFGKKEALSGPYKYDMNIYNEGGANLEVNIQLVTQAPEGVFNLENADFTIVKPGSSGDMFGKDFSVIFNPPYEAGNFEASVEINSNDTENSKFVVDIEGESEGGGSIRIVNTYTCSIIPNIINSTANINFSISSALEKDVNINILDLTGKVIKTLVEESYSIGDYSILFDATNLVSGSYFVEYIIDGHRTTIPFKIVK